MSAGNVLQSGTVTPGHLVTWTTDGVIQDGGGLPSSTLQILASARTMNFNTTTDQAIYIPPSVVAFQLTGITVTNASLSLTTAAGGFYPAVGKSGTAIVAAGQSYASLTTANLLLACTIAATPLVTRYSSANLPVTTILGLNYLTIYLSLTSPQGTPATADVYLLGFNLT